MMLATMSRLHCKHALIKLANFKSKQPRRDWLGSLRESSLYSRYRLQWKRLDYHTPTLERYSHTYATSKSFRSCLAELKLVLFYGKISNLGTGWLTQLTSSITTVTTMKREFGSAGYSLSSWKQTCWLFRLTKARLSKKAYRIDIGKRIQRHLSSYTSLVKLNQ